MGVSAPETRQRPPKGPLPGVFPFFGFPFPVLSPSEPPANRLLTDPVSSAVLTGLQVDFPDGGFENSERFPKGGLVRAGSRCFTTSRGLYAA